MTGPHTSRPAVVCDDRPALRGPVGRLLQACGYDVRAVATCFAPVSDLAHEHAACVAVVALPLVGMSGLLAVRALREAVPTCEVVLLSSSQTLALAAVEAGARALVPEDDLRGLRGVLLELSGAARSVGVPEPRPYAAGGVTGRASTKPSS